MFKKSSYLWLKVQVYKCASLGFRKNASYVGPAPLSCGRSYHWLFKAAAVTAASNAIASAATSRNVLDAISTWSYLIFYIWSVVDRGDTGPRRARTSQLSLDMSSLPLELAGIGSTWGCYISFSAGLRLFLGGFSSLGFESFVKPLQPLFYQ